MLSSKPHTHSRSIACRLITLMSVITLAIFSGMILKKTMIDHSKSSTLDKGSTLTPHDAVRSPQNETKSGSCIWKPDYDGDCLRAFKQNHSIILKNRRWLFLGASTVSRLFAKSDLHKYLLDSSRVKIACQESIQCRKVHAGRCDTLDVLKMARRTTWDQPNFTKAEGPVKNGLLNPFCQDCGGCDSVLMFCSETTQSPNPRCSSTYGGFISVEFARDVELQTELYSTTQENLISYIENQWNTPWLVSHFGRPICVIRTGNHDIAIPNVTLAAYAENVQWYLDMLSKQCDGIVWLSNTCPQADGFVQTKALTREWNEAARSIVSRFKNSVFVDVFDASITWPHADNIHMNDDWYRALGGMLLQVMKSQ